MIDCSKCNGACCRHIGRIIPYLNRGDECCIHFNEEKHNCKIYDHRPLICNTDRLYDALYKDIMSREEYDRLNADACQRLSIYVSNS